MQDNSISNDPKQPEYVGMYSPVHISNRYTNGQKRKVYDHLCKSFLLLIPATALTTTIALARDSVFSMIPLIAGLAYAGWSLSQAEKALEIHRD